MKSICTALLLTALTFVMILSVKNIPFLNTEKLTCDIYLDSGNCKNVYTFNELSENDYINLEFINHANNADNVAVKIIDEFGNEVIAPIAIGLGQGKFIDNVLANYTVQAKASGRDIAYRFHITARRYDKKILF